MIVASANPLEPCNNKKLPNVRLHQKKKKIPLPPSSPRVQVSMYDKRGEGRADSAEFLKDFWQVGREGRESQTRRRLQMVRRVHVSTNTDNANLAAQGRGGATLNLMLLTLLETVQ